MRDRFGKFGNIIWVLVFGAQGGLILAVPVLAGLALGYWLDTRYETLPWITLGLTLFGAITGPLLLYRWMNAVVKERMSKKIKQQEEEKLE